MTSFEHKRIAKTVALIDVLPEGSDQYASWIKAISHLKFLQDNSHSDEIILYACGEYTFVTSAVVPNSRLYPPDQRDLLYWSGPQCSSIASYVTGGGREGVWLEKDWTSTNTRTLEHTKPLFFDRTFEGWSGDDASYFEMHQEFTHLAEIHWRPEERAYCKYDSRGDLEPVVSASNRDQDQFGVRLLSCQWKPLEEYLSVTNSSLVQLFDFTLLRYSIDFRGWDGGQEIEVSESPLLFYRQLELPGYAAYTRGAQIVPVRRNDTEIQKELVDQWFGREEQKHVEFIAYDWRNKRVASISTDPRATTNYFAAKSNDLPFEVSPAFFRSDVLSKYKADRDKYQVSERDVRCRAAWRLEAYDVNEAGQVFAYIRYLRRLPYEEQLHWLSHNEEPKAGISKRAVINDFEGKTVDFQLPLSRLLSLVRRWHQESVPWWKLRDLQLLDRVARPLTQSRDEWAEANLDLAKLVVEGFQVKEIRARLEASEINYEQEDGSIRLMEILRVRQEPSCDGDRFNGLRECQKVRSVVKSHANGTKARELSQAVLLEHETYTRHFDSLCEQISSEMEAIEQLMR